MPIQQNNNSKNPKKKPGKTETITELAHRHLSDESHTTSDEELRNATVEFSETPQVPDDNLFELDNSVITNDDSDETKTDENGNDDAKHDNPPNPYTVLGS